MKDFLDAVAPFLLVFFILSILTSVLYFAGQAQLIGINDTVAIVETKQVEEAQISLLAKIEGIGLPIPLSEKEIQLHALKDELLAIVSSIGEKQKELDVKKKEVAEKELALKERERIPAMAKGWRRMSEEKPPKGRMVLFYDTEFSNFPYKIMSYLGTGKRIDFQISIGNNNIQKITSDLGADKTTYWIYLEDFAGEGKPSDESKKTVAVKKSSKIKYAKSTHLKKEMSPDDVLALYGLPATTSAITHSGGVEEKWTYYKYKKNGFMEGSNYLSFEDGKLTYWKLDFKFERIK